MKKVLRRKQKSSKGLMNLNYGKIITCLALAYTVSLTPGYGQQIIIDGNTNTSLNTNGTVTDVTTMTIKGNNAFNSFSKFNVNAGNTVNLIVPDSSSSLINLIHDEATQIDGILRSFQNGQIGGNIFLVNPYGITVGANGVVNVGALTAVTPTTNFMNNFFLSPGNPDDASVNALLNGTAPVNPLAEINIQGKINAITDVKLDGGDVSVTGDLYTDAKFAYKPEIGDIVNLNSPGLNEDPWSFVFENGQVAIKAAGEIYQDGAILAGKNVEFTGNSVDLGVNSLIVNNKNFTINAVNDAELSGTVYSYGNADISSTNGSVSFYDGSSLESAKNINVTSPLDILVDGNLGTRAGAAYLRVFEDNTFDPDSNIAAVIDNGNLIVAPVSTSDVAGGDINLTGNITGSGSLQALYGPGEIDIINDSLNNLVTNDLLVDGSIDHGKIVVNGTELTSNIGNIEVVLGGNNTDLSRVNVKNNSTSDILLNGNVLSNPGTIDFTNIGGNILSDGQTITGDFINFSTSSEFSFLEDDPANLQYIAFLNTDLNGAGSIELNSDAIILSASRLINTEGSINLDASTGVVLLPDVSHIINNFNFDSNDILSGKLLNDIAQNADQFPDPATLERTYLEATGDVDINSGLFFVDLFSDVHIQGDFSSDSTITIIGGDSTIWTEGDVTLSALKDDKFGVVYTAGMSNLADIATIMNNPLDHKPDNNDLLGFPFTPQIIADRSFSIVTPVNDPTGLINIPSAGVGNPNILSTFSDNFDNLGIILLTNTYTNSWEDTVFVGDAIGIIDSDIESATKNIEIGASIGVALLPEVSYLPDFFTSPSSNLDINYVKDYLAFVANNIDSYSNYAGVPTTVLTDAGDINIDQGVLFTSVFSDIEAGKDFTTNSMITNFVGYNNIETGGNINIKALNDDKTSAILFIGLEGLMDAFNKDYEPSDLFYPSTSILSGGDVNLLTIDPAKPLTDISDKTTDDVFNFFREDLDEGHLIGLLDSSIFSGGSLTMTSDVTALVGSANHAETGNLTVVSTLGTLALPDFIPLFGQFLDPENVDGQISLANLDPFYYYRTELDAAAGNVDIYSGILFADLFSDMTTTGNIVSNSTLTAIGGNSLLISMGNLDLRATNTPDTGVIVALGADGLFELSNKTFHNFGLNIEFTDLPDVPVQPVFYADKSINIDTGLFNGTTKDDTNPLKDLHVVGLLNAEQLYAETQDINITGDIIGIMGTPVKAKLGDLNIISSTGTVVVLDLIPLIPALTDPDNPQFKDLGLNGDQVDLFPFVYSMLDTDPSTPDVITLPDFNNMTKSSLEAGNDINIYSGLLFGDAFADITSGNSTNIISIGTAIIGDVQINTGLGDFNILATDNPSNGIVLMSGLTELVLGVDDYLNDVKIDDNFDPLALMGLYPTAMVGKDINILTIPVGAQPQSDSGINNTKLVPGDNDLPEGNYVAILGYDIHSYRDVNINGDIVAIKGSQITSETGSINIAATAGTLLLPDYIPLFEYLEDGGKPIDGNTLILNPDLLPVVPDININDPADPLLFDLAQGLRTKLTAPNTVNIDSGILYAQLFSDLEAGSNINIASTLAAIAGDSKITSGNDVNISASYNNDYGAVVMLGADSLLNLTDIAIKNQNLPVSVDGLPFEEQYPTVMAQGNINITSVPYSVIPLNQAGNDDDFSFLDEIPDGHYVTLFDYNLMAGNNINIISDDFTVISGTMLNADQGNINITSGQGTLLLPSYLLYIDELLKPEFPVGDNIFLSQSINKDISPVKGFLDLDIPILDEFIKQNLTEEELNQLLEVQGLKTNLLAAGDVNINSGVVFVDLFSDVMAGGSFTSTSVATLIGGDSSIFADGNINISATNASDMGMIALVSQDYLLKDDKFNELFFTPMLYAGGDINFQTSITGGNATVPDDYLLKELGLSKETLTGVIGYDVTAEGSINMSGDYVAALDSNIITGYNISLNSSLGTVLSPYYEEFVADSPRSGIDGDDLLSLPSLLVDFDNENRTSLIAGHSININAGGMFADFYSDIYADEDFSSTSTFTAIIGNSSIYTGDDMTIKANNNPDFGGILILGLDDFDLFDFDFDDIPTLIADDDIELESYGSGDSFPDLNLLDSTGFVHFENFIPQSLHMIGIFDSVVFAMDDIDVDSEIVIIDDSFVESGRSLLFSIAFGFFLLPGEIAFGAPFLPFDPIGEVIDPFDPIDPFGPFPGTFEPTFDDTDLPGLVGNVEHPAKLSTMEGDIIINTGGNFVNLFGQIDGGNNVNINANSNMMLGNTYTSSGFASVNMTENTGTFGTFKDSDGLLSSIGFEGEFKDYVNPDNLDYVNSIPNNTGFNAFIGTNINVNNGNINGGNIEAYGGNLNINVPNGNVNLDHVSTPDMSSIVAGGTEIIVDTFDPTIAVFQVLSQGGNLTINNGLASNAVNINADNVNVKFNDNDTVNPLQVAISGNDGGLANNVNIDVGSTQGINVTNLQTNNATINNTVNNTILNLSNTNVTNLITITSTNVNATSNINLNTANITGYSNQTASSVIISNNSDLTINQLNTNTANITTTSNNLNINNAIVNNSATFANNTNTVVVDNSGNTNLNGADLVIGTDGLFNLDLNSASEVNTDADVIIASSTLDITGDYTRPEINNDISQTTSTADEKIEEAMNRNNQQTSQDDYLSILNNFISLDNPDLYLDDDYQNLTVSILLKAVELYNNTITQSGNESEALKKATMLLQNANIDSNIAKQLLKKETFKNNKQFNKLLRYISTKPEE